MAEPSVDGMKMASSALVVSRFEYLMLQQARTVLAEVNTTANHALRVVYAKKIVQDPRFMAAAAAPMIVGGINLLGTLVTNANPDLVDSSANDAAVLSQIATFWDPLSGVAT